MKARLQTVIGLMDRLERKYNADEDCVPGQPLVYYADMELAQAIRHMVEVLDKQEQRLEALEQELASLKEERSIDG